MISFVALAAGERRPGANLIQGWCEKGVPVAASIRGIFPSLVNDGYPLQDRIFGLGLGLGFAGAAALELRDPLCDRSISQDSRIGSTRGARREEIL